MTEVKRYGKKYYLEYLLMYTVAFAIVTTGIFFFFIKNGRSLLWFSDGLSIYIPKAYYFMGEVKNFFTNLLHGHLEFPMYDFSIGMGDTPPIHFEPLYWIFLLFGQEHIEAAFNTVFMVRFFLAGLSMSAFLLYFKNSRGGALLGSFAYIYTEFTLGSASRHSQFMVPMILLPLCLLALEEILRKRNWYIFTILIWIHIWCGYYFLYMDTIAMGTYFLVRFFMNPKGRSIKNFFVKGFTIAGTYLLGIMIGNITLLSSFASYLGSSRTMTQTAGKVGAPLLYSNLIKRALQLFRSFMTIGRTSFSGLRLGFVPLLYLSIILLFLYRRNWQRKVFVLLYSAFCFMPIIAYIFSGFDSLTYRWSYIYALVLAANLSFGLKDLVQLDTKRKIILSAFTLPYFAMYIKDFLTEKSSVRYMVLISAVTLFLAILSVWIANEKKLSWKKKCIVLFAAQTIALWGLGAQQFSDKMDDLGSEFVVAGKVLQKASESPLTVTAEIEDDSFYRVATNESRFSIRGTAQMYGYNSTVYDQNTASRSWNEFYQKLGLSQWTLVRKRGFNGRSFLETLADVKYYVAKKGEERDVPYGYKYLTKTKKGKKTYKIYENKYALPIGYTYAHTITPEQFDTYTTAERAEVLMQAAVTDTAVEDGFTPTLTSKKAEILDITCKNATIEGDTITLIPDNGEEARIDITFKPQEKCELYLCMNGMHRTGSSKNDVWYGTDSYEERYVLHGENNSYYTGQLDYVFSLGYYDEAVSTCYFTTNTAMTLKCDEICIVAQPMDNLKQYTKELRSQALENVVVGNNTVTGDISLKEDNYLVFSIPYRRGWKAYVDGEETKLEYANILYMGFPLSAGEHTIELRYCTEGIAYSLIASAAGLLILILGIVITKKKNNAKG